MSKISGFTWNGTADNKFGYVNTKEVASGATALIVSLEDTNVTLTAGEINVSSFQSADGTPSDAYALLDGTSINTGTITFLGFGGYDAVNAKFEALNMIATGTASVHGLAVAIVDGAGNQVTSFGLAVNDDSSFTAATGSGTPMMGYATTDQVSVGDVGVLAMNIDRQLETAGYTRATQSNRSEEVDPLDQKYISETLVDDLAYGTATTYWYVDMNGFRNNSGQIQLNSPGGTITVTAEASIQDDGTAHSGWRDRY